MPADRRLEPRTKSALLWGAVGCMAFLVLLQGYALASGPLVSIGRGALLAVGVGVATAGIAYAIEQWVAVWSARRVEE